MTDKQKRIVLPTPHEVAILRRLAGPGQFLMVTFRKDEDPLYTYENGQEIHSSTGNPLTPQGFKRLCQWLDPVEGEALFDDVAPQRWRARRLA